MIFVAIEGMINDLMDTITTAAVAPQVATLGTIIISIHLFNSSSC